MILLSLLFIITLCFNGFMWIYCDSPGCIKERIWLCLMYDM